MNVVDISKWRQGVLFSAPEISVVWNMLSEGESPGITTKFRKPRPGEKFVLISQTCDIIRVKKLRGLNPLGGVNVKQLLPLKDSG